MAADKFSLIILNNPTQGQRYAVHGRVKKVTGSWWHEYDDIWIVQSATTPAQWIDQLQGFFKKDRAGELPRARPSGDRPDAELGYFGPEPQRAGELVAQVLHQALADSPK